MANLRRRRVGNRLDKQEIGTPFQCICLGLATQQLRDLCVASANGRLGPECASWDDRYFDVRKLPTQAGPDMFDYFCGVAHDVAELVYTVDEDDDSFFIQTALLLPTR